MPLNLVFTSADNNTVNDDGIYGNNTSVIRNGSGQVIYTLIHPVDSILFTTNGAPNINFNLNFTDGLGAANFTMGSLSDPAASFNAITVNKIQTSGIVTLVANQAITESGSDAGVDITAVSLILSAVTGIATPANALETQVSTLEAETVTGGISINNLGVLQVGGATAEVAGLSVQTSGDINLINTGSILLADTNGAESVHGGNSSGNVTLIAKGLNADIMSILDNDAISAAGGNISLTAGRDVAFGVSGLDFDNDVRAKGSITVNAGRDFLIDGFSDLASDDFVTNSAGNVIINAGRNIEVRNITGTDGSIAAGGSVGADVILTTGTGGSVVLNAPSQLAIQSNSGDVIVNTDRMLISAMSGITANNGAVALQTSTVGYEINLGSVTDSAFALELSDAELDRVFSPTLIVGDENTGNMTVSSAISLNSANATLRSGEDVVVAADLSNATAITVDAGHNFFHSAGVITTGVLTVLVDSANQGGGVGSLGNNIIASTIILSGNAGADVLNGSNVADIINGMGGNDTITGGGGIDTINGGNGNDTISGGTSTDEIVHGDAGNDTLNSGGDGHYYGDAGDDLINAGLTFVSEILDGGDGVDTLDTTTFVGDYQVNLLTGLTDFGGESFTNFENLITGNGSDTIIGTDAANFIVTNAGNDNISAAGGNDTIEGGSGADTMQGGLGDDNYYVDNVADQTIEASSAGTDKVFSSVTYSIASQFVEQLFLTGVANINATGNGLDNILVGNGANNTLNGGVGADNMQGSFGDDIYFVDNIGDFVAEASGAGTDKVFSSVTYSVASQFVEQLWLTGADNINATGNGLNNVIIGNSGNNVITGGAGVDNMQGGLGNDSYFVDSASDIVAEAGGAGTDTIYSTVSFVQSVNVENLVLTGAANINATGNSLANLLKGNTGNNILDGQAGNDTLVGVSGADTAMYQLLNGADARGGNGSDSWTDFTVGNTAINTNADKIDIGDLLIGYGGGGTLAALDPYLTVNISGSNTTVLIDRDGAGGTYTDTLLLTLNGVNTSLLTLINNNQILI